MDIVEFLKNCVSIEKTIEIIEIIISEDELETKKYFAVEKLPDKILKYYEDKKDNNNVETLLSVLYLFAQKIDKVKYLDTYYKTIFNTKIIIVSTNDSLKEKIVNWAFRKWINICMNYDADISVRTFFDIKKINPEEQIKDILFDENGDLRKNFKNNEKLKYILPVVSDWFLKRYNIKDFLRISKYETREKNKSTKPRVKIKSILKALMPRMIAGIIVGYIPLISAIDIWDWLLLLNCQKLLFLAIISFLFCFLYLRTEIRNKVKDKFDCIERTNLILFISIIESLCIGAFVVLFWGTEILKLSNKTMTFENAFQILTGYSLLALLFGIFLQIIWEDKPITHPI